MDKQYIVAIEIGSSKTVGAIAEKSPQGHVTLKALVTESTLQCVRYGCIMNVESTKATINNIIRRLGTTYGTISEVYVGISGRSLHSMPTETTHILNPDETITGAVLEQMKNEACHDTLPNYDIIGIIPRNYIVDKLEVRNPVGNIGSTIRASYNLIVAKPNVQTNLKRAMNQHAIKAIIPTALAVADAVLTDDERSLGCMLVDLGAETTTVSIYRNDALLYLTTLPIGGRNITRDLTSLGIREETAEKIKKNSASPLNPTAESVTIEGIKSSEAANYIVARVGEIIANINQQLSNAGLTSADIRTIVLTGGGALLTGIDAKVVETMNVRVRQAISAPDTLRIDTPAVNTAENIGVMSLLLAAARLLPDGESCTYQEQYIQAPDFTIQTPVTPEPAKPEPEKQAKQRKSNRFTRALSHVKKILSDVDEQDDNY